jgi:DNA (cytosine-5)-methyltransferase 1
MEYPIIASLRSRQIAEPVGVPVGVVFLPCQRLIDRFRTILQGAVEGKLRFRGIDIISAAAKNAVVVHLPVAAAITMDTACKDNAEMVAFMQETGAEWLPGIRLHDPVLKKKGLPTIPLQTSDELAPLKFAQPEASGASFTFAELFAGIGGFRLGLEALGGRCTLASEIDAAAIDTYSHNFDGDTSSKTHMMASDITEYYASQLPDFDILTGGFPCQPFSNRGSQDGLADREKGGLYLELVRLLRAKQPLAFMFENVVGLVLLDGGTRAKRLACQSNVADEGELEGTCSSHGTDEYATTFTPGKVFCGMLAAFDSCGYAVTWRVVNSRHWLPQRRERVYIVGRKRRSERQSPGGNWVGGLVSSDSSTSASASATSTSGQAAEKLRAQQRWFNWGAVCPPATDACATSTVRSIMERHSENTALAECELTPAQWKIVQGQCALLPLQRRGKLSRGERAALGVDAEQKCRLPLQDGSTIGEVAGEQEALVSGLRDRAVHLDGKAPTLVSGYHKVGNFTTKYCFEERDGTLRVGGLDSLRADVHDGDADAGDAAALQAARSSDTNLRPRFFSPRECARLMGFPDSFQIPSRKNESQNGFYRQIGNAVCPPVIQSIGAELLRALHRQELEGQQ